MEAIGPQGTALQLGIVYTTAEWVDAVEAWAEVFAKFEREVSRSVVGR
jgi:hypothetical protein